MRLPQPGDLFLERYQIVGVLGDGGSGRVYHATDVAAGRPVALKILKPAPQGYDDDARARFDREVHILASLRDPHSVTMYDAGQAPDGLLFIVSEFVPGEDLSRVLAREGSLSPDVVRRILTQVLLSLSEAHAAGLLHRDIKPENIRVFERGGDPYHVKVLDFGIARSVTALRDSITKTGELVGTPRYMSPEQLTEQRLSPASDIYSLGIVALEMLLGAEALHGPRWADQFDRLQSGHQFSIPALDRAEALANVVVRMTARDPSRRYPTAEAVLRALENGNGERAPRVLSPPAVAAGPADRAHANWGVGAGVAVALACGLALVFALRRDADEPQASRVVRSSPPTPLLRGSSEPSVPDVSVPAEPLPGCGKPVPFTRTGVLQEVQGLSRHTLFAYVPTSYDGSTDYPLIVAFHEDGQTPEQIVLLTELADLAEAHGALVVAPTGNSLPMPSWGRPGRLGVMQHDLLRKVVGDLDLAFNQLCVDPQRVYAFGHGPGGVAATTLACEDDRFAAVATTAYRMHANGVRCDRAVPTLLLTGLHDGHLPVHGGMGCSIAFKMSLAAHEEHYRELNACSDTPSTYAKHGPNDCVTWDCQTPFVSCYLDGGRGWPLMTSIRPLDAKRCDGEPADFPFGETIWEFFAANPRQ